MARSVINLFRMTHIENIPHIIDFGITHADSENRNPSFKAIGDESLISRRSTFLLFNGKSLSNYIPFYFGQRMPMLYVIQKGVNGVPITRPEEIVYVVSSVQQIEEHNIDFLFTDGHAVNSFTQFYNPTQIIDFHEIVDMKAVKVKYWKDPNDLDLKRRKEAEFLVAADIPTTAIRGYVVYNQIAYGKMSSYDVPSAQIAIKPNYYF